MDLERLKCDDCGIPLQKSDGDTYWIMRLTNKVKNKGDVISEKILLLCNPCANVATGPIKRILKRKYSKGIKHLKH